MAGGLASTSLLIGFADTLTLTWTGKYSEIWDLTEKNWTNSDGQEVAWVNNSDALFNDGAESFTVRFTNNAVRANCVVFNTSGAFVITNSASKQYLYSADSIRKLGTGTLNVNPASSTLINEISAGIFVDEGSAVFTGQSLFLKIKEKPDVAFFAGTNATLHFAMRNIFGTDNFNPVIAPIVIKNGTFKASDANGHLAIGPLTLDNAEFDYSGLSGYNDKLGVMTFSGRVSFKGDSPYHILQTGFGTDSRTTAKKFCLWSDPKSEFCVDDITGDNAEDVVIGAMLADHCKQTAYTNKEDPSKNRELVMAPGGLIKTGPGTLSLTNQLNTFSGDIEVREGTLQAGPNWQLNASTLADTEAKATDHWLGCLTNENRKIIVKKGALLYFPNRNCFGTQGGITNLMPGVKVTFVFDGGVFTNFDGQGFILPNVEFSNGGSIAPGYGPANYGRFMVKEFFTVKGSIPFEWNLSNAARNNVNSMSQEALTLNGYPENVFDIADVTNDSTADATFGVPFIIGYGYFRTDTAWGDHKLEDWKFGFRKTGAGTMRIAAPKMSIKNADVPSKLASRSFNGDSKVEEGELCVDGDISLSDTVQVYAGAYLSGTGLVNNVSIAQGGGLRVRDGQKDALRIGGKLSVADGLRIEVLLADGADMRDVRAKVLAVTGEIEGAESLVSASVFVDGVSVPNIKLRLDDGALSLRYMRGTTVVIR